MGGGWHIALLCHLNNSSTSLFFRALAFPLSPLCADPVGIAADPFGNLVIGESWQATIRRVDAVTGFVSTIVPASAGTQVQGVGADGLGN